MSMKLPAVRDIMDRLMLDDLMVDRLPEQIGILCCQVSAKPVDGVLPVGKLITAFADHQPGEKRTDCHDTSPGAFLCHLAPDGKPSQDVPIQPAIHSVPAAAYDERTACVGYPLIIHCK